MRALLRCGLAADHPRVRAARAWLEQESRRIDWRQELAEALLQRPDGSWHNDHSFLKEDDPLIATTLAAAALANCQATR